MLFVAASPLQSLIVNGMPIASVPVSAVAEPVVLFTHTNRVVEAIAADDPVVTFWIVAPQVVTVPPAAAVVQSPVNGPNGAALPDPPETP